MKSVINYILFHSTVIEPLRSEEFLIENFALFDTITKLYSKGWKFIKISSISIFTPLKWHLDEKEITIPDLSLFWWFIELKNEKKKKKRLFISSKNKKKWTLASLKYEHILKIINQENSVRLNIYSRLSLHFVSTKVNSENNVN